MIHNGKIEKDTCNHVGCQECTGDVIFEVCSCGAFRRKAVWNKEHTKIIRTFSNDTWILND